jgi:hypothetical protein
MVREGEASPIPGQLGRTSRKSRMDKLRGDKPADGGKGKGPKAKDAPTDKTAESQFDTQNTLNQGPAKRVRTSRRKSSFLETLPSVAEEAPSSEAQELMTRQEYITLEIDGDTVEVAHRNGEDHVRVTLQNRQWITMISIHNLDSPNRFTLMTGQDLPEGADDNTILEIDVARLTIKTADDLVQGVDDHPTWFWSAAVRLLLVTQQFAWDHNTITRQDITNSAAFQNLQDQLQLMIDERDELVTAGATY